MKPFLPINREKSIDVKSILPETGTDPCEADLVVNRISPFRDWNRRFRCSYCLRDPTPSIEFNEKKPGCKAELNCWI